MCYFHFVKRAAMKKVLKFFAISLLIGPNHVMAQTPSKHEVAAERAKKAAPYVICASSRYGLARHRTATPKVLENHVYENAGPDVHDLLRKSPKVAQSSSKWIRTKSAGRVFFVTSFISGIWAAVDWLYSDESGSASNAKKRTDWSAADEIDKLNKQRLKGGITQAEYEKLKAKIINN